MFLLICGGGGAIWGIGRVSIHLMFLLIPNNHTYSDQSNFVSIHLMFLLIKSKKKDGG